VAADAERGAGPSESVSVEAGDIRQRERAGIRAWIFRSGRNAGDGLRWLAPRALVSGLTASAFAGFVVSGPTSAVLAGVGGSYLSDVLGRFAQRLRDEQQAQPERPLPGIEAVTARLAEELESALEANDSTARGLRSDMAQVLREIGAVEVAVGAAIESATSGSSELAQALVTALGTLGSDLADFRFVLAEARETTGRILVETTALRAERQHHDAEHRYDLVRRREDSTRLTLIYELAREIEARTRDLDTGHWPRLGRSAGAAAESPYRGLWPFGEDHAEWFHGRERVTAELVGRLAERLTSPGLIVVSGASGVGKSSLLRAGLLPALARDGLPVEGAATWPWLVLTPTRTPLAELATHIAQVNGGVLATEIESELRRSPVSAHLLVRQSLLGQATHTNEDARLIVIVDQLEELFTLGVPETDRNAFLDALQSMSEVGTGPDDRPVALVVVAVRGDFWERCAAHRQLAGALQDAQFVVPAMEEPDLARAVTGPAASAGLELESGLLDLVLRDLRADRPDGAAGALPLLSQALLSTWENREGDRLTIRGYGASGGVHHAVERSADAAYDSLTSAQQDLARTVLRRMITVNSSGQLTRRRVRRSDLSDDDVDAVVSAFVSRRLVIVDQDTVEIAHDSLPAAWPRLRSWLRDDIADQFAHDKLVEDAHAWDEHDRDRSFLYQGARLDTVRQAADRWHNDPTTSSFLETSTRAAIRRSRQNRLALTTLVVLLVVSLVTSIAWQRQARSAADRATAQALLTTSEGLRISNRRVSAQLAAAAARIDASDTTRQALRTAILRLGPGAFIVDDQDLDDGVDMLFSDDLEVVTADGEHDETQRWSTRTARPLGAPLSGHRATASADGSVLATLSDSGQVRLWNPATGERRAGPLTGASRIVAIAVAPDGATLATLSVDGSVSQWQTDTGERIPGVLSGMPEPDEILSDATIQYSPDGKDLTASLASSSSAGRPVVTAMCLWDLANHQLIGRPSDDVVAFAFNPTSEVFVTATSDGRTEIRDRHTGHILYGPLTNGPAVVRAVSFTHGGTMLATADEQGRLDLWETSTGQRVGELQSEDGIAITNLAFTHSDHVLAAADESGEVHLWDVPHREELGPPWVIGVDLNGLAFSSDDHHIAIGATDGTVMLRAVPAKYRIGPTNADSTTTISWSFGGGRVAATNDHTSVVQVWDTTAGRPLGDPVDSELTALAPDGTMLATSYFGSRVLLWRVTDDGPQPSPRELPVRDPDLMAFSPNGENLVVGRGSTPSNDESDWSLWDTKSGKLIRAGGNYGPERSIDLFNPIGVILDPRGDAFITNGERDSGTLRLWDAATGQARNTIVIDRGTEVDPAGFSGDGTVVAVNTAEGTLQLWDTTTWRRLQTFTFTSPEIAIDQTGTALAVIRDDGSVELWDVATGQLVGEPLDAYVGPVSNVMFSSDGKTLISAAYDGTVVEHDMSFLTMDEEELVDLICRRTGQPLSRDEWDTYLPNLPYKETCPQ
jgi:WD40 repeat protein